MLKVLLLGMVQNQGIKLLNKLNQEHILGSKEFTKEITSEGDDRLRVKITVAKGKATDIVVQYESKIKKGQMVCYRKI